MIRRVGFAMLLILGLLWASHAQLLRAVANGLDVSEPILPSDYVVVLPGGPETRTFAAVVILREGLAKRTAILRNPETNAVQEGLRLPTHEMTQRIFQERGIAEERMFFLDGESRTTHSDLELIGSILETDPDATITIVTNRFHTRRARWAAARIYGEKLERFSFVGAPSDAFVWETWWQSQRGLDLILAEYLKLGYYMVVYSTSMQRLAVVAIALGSTLVAVVWLRRRRRIFDLHHEQAQQT
ncbi:YdcF family protein [Rosistilla oblonga]|uniref:YdcF family protein n=1 Tax=Rosistilla oblonga TaxID=2527990 RepID=UPI003A982EA7